MKEVQLENIIKWFIVSLPYVLGGIFLVAAAARWMIYYTVSRHEWFAREFEKRVYKYLDSEENKNASNTSFYVLSKKLLEKAYYESFAIRDRKSKESMDHVMSMNDRIFLVKQGCAWMVKDILKQLRYLKWSKETPKLLHITKATLHHNPCFNRLFGIIPMGALNELISILPGLFVVAGVLGTFLGIKSGLVALGGMDLQDLEGTKNIMDSFLHEIGFAMTSSVVGIIFSLALHVVNTSLSPERLFVSLVDRFESTMDLLWYRSDNNVIPENIEKFDETKDPVETLAEDAVNVEFERTKKQFANKVA